MESELIYNIRNTAWIYNREGECFRPKDIYLKEIAEEYFTDTPLLSDFGTLLEFKPDSISSDLSLNTAKK